MKKNFVSITAVMLIALLFSGCAKVPQVEIDAAKSAVENLKTVEANRYLPEEFNAMHDSLNLILTSVETEKSKFFLSRSYSDITLKLNTIIASSEELKTKTEEQKAKVREEVQAAVTETTNLISENKELLKKAPKGKEGKAALEAIQNDITIIEASLDEVNTLVTNGDYLTAKDKVNVSKQKAISINSELTTAIAKTQKRKK